MKTLMCIRLAALAAPALLSLIACSSEPEMTPGEKAAAAAVPGAPPSAADAAKADNATASNVREDTDLFEFAYGYPAEAAKLPKLAAWLDGDRTTKRDALVAEARRDRALAEKQGFPYRAHIHVQKWLKVTSIPRFLSLSSEIDSYTGGAHGMTAFESLLWDRNRAMLRKPLDLFISGEAFDTAIRDEFCAAIERAKAAKGIERPEEPGSVFSECPPASAQTVWLGSSDGRHFDRLTIAIAPYEIGSYAEGDYRVNVPMTSALVAAVKPEFARDFLPVR